ncbi:MAG: hypothetical protein R3Y53_07980 [Bacillota bacterium]
MKFLIFRYLKLGDSVDNLIKAEDRIVPYLFVSTYDTTATASYTYNSASGSSPTTTDITTDSTFVPTI